MKEFRSLMPLLCGVLLLSACGGGTTMPLPTPTPSIGPTQSPPPPPLTVALTQFTKVIDMGQSDSLTATVSNDPNHKGVDWTVTCPPAVKACGGMVAASTVSGAADIYNAPSSVSTTETLIVVAAAAADPSKSASVQVTVNPTLALVSPAPAPPPRGTVGQAFSLDLMQYVAGGSSPFAWSIKSGALPLGLTLNPATGVVSGIPTTATTSALAVGLIFLSNDSGNPAESVSVPISLTINPTPPPPPLIIASPGAMPSGVVGAAYGPFIGYQGRGCKLPILYGVLLQATGGVPPYGWSWAAAPGYLVPPGLSPIHASVSTCDFNPNGRRFVDTISGTPTTAGTYNVVVTVTDSESPAMKTSKNYTIIIH